MSLIIKEILNRVEDKSFLSFDGVLPFVLSFSDIEDNAEILHYELITANDSFFEIEIYQNSGQLKALTLLNCNVLDVLGVESAITPDIIMEEGSPIIDTKYFNGNSYFDSFKREHGFKVYIDNSKNICISIKDLVLEKYICLSENCYFGLSSDMELISIILLDLNEEQFSLFKETFAE